MTAATVTAGSTLDELWGEYYRLDRIMAANAGARTDEDEAVFDAARDAWFDVKRWIGWHDAARRGIAHLDATAEGWLERVPADERLDMSIGWRQYQHDATPTTCGCIGVWLYGEYDSAHFGLTGEQAAKCGFVIPSTPERSIAGFPVDYPDLTAAWRTELLALRAERGLS